MVTLLMWLRVWGQLGFDNVGWGWSRLGLWPRECGLGCVCALARGVGGQHSVALGRLLGCGDGDVKCKGLGEAMVPCLPN